MKNDKWFQDILDGVSFGEGFPMTTFYFHPLYRVGVGKDTNLDYTFGKDKKLPFKNLRKFKFFKFQAPFPPDSVIFFQPKRKRLIVSSQREGKVLKISVWPNQLALLQSEIQELKFQNRSEFAPHSVKFLDSGENWIMTSFCSNRDSVSKLPILELQSLVIGPLTKFYLAHGVQKIRLKEWIKEAKIRAEGHPHIELVFKLISKIEEGPDIELLKGQLHFDLHQGNVLRDRDQLVIIDWEVSHPGLLLVDYFDFYRRHVKKEKGKMALKEFSDGFRDWLKSFDIVMPEKIEELLLQLYSLERTLIYFDKWREDRFADKNGFEYQIASGIL